MRKSQDSLFNGTANRSYTWLATTNLLAPINWTMNSTGTLDGAGAFSNATPNHCVPIRQLFLVADAVKHAQGFQFACRPKTFN